MINLKIFWICVFKFLCFLFYPFMIADCVITSKKWSVPTLIPENSFGNSMGTLWVFWIASGTLLELHKSWTFGQLCICIFLAFYWKDLLNRYCVQRANVGRITTNQEVLGSSPSRCTNIAYEKNMNFKWLINASLLKSVIYFFIFVFIILLILTFVL